MKLFKIEIEDDVKDDIITIIEAIVVAKDKDQAFKLAHRMTCISPSHHVDIKEINIGKRSRVLLECVKKNVVR